MYQGIIRKQLCLAAIFTVAAVIIVSVFGARFTAGSTIGEHGEMNGCLFMMMEESALCRMSVSDHLSVWRNIFIGIFQFFMILGLILAVFFQSIWRMPDKRRLIGRQYSRAEKISIALADYLKIITSRGRLKPKIY